MNSGCTLSLPRKTLWFFLEDFLTLFARAGENYYVPAVIYLAFRTIYTNSSLPRNSFRATRIDTPHNIPEISVKCRIGVDDNDSYSDLTNFIDSVTAVSPVKTFQIHARKVRKTRMCHSRFSHSV